MAVPAAGVAVPVRTRVPGNVRHVAGGQRGVALVTALLVVSLVTVTAVAMATRQHVDVRRTANLIHGEQAYDYALAAESWAQVILVRDLEESDYDALSEDWATALPPIAVEGGLVNGVVEDLQGRFNLNNLAGVGDSGNDEGNPDDAQKTLAYFRRLLDILGIDTTLADALLDWLDEDINVRFPNGAEDEYYLLLDRPYRAANRLLTSVSELRLVKGFEPEVVELLLPYVTALPVTTPINVNTASAVVLQALNPELDEDAVRALIADRGEHGFENINDFLGNTELAGLKLDMDVDVTSSFFRVLTDVQIGQSRAQLESLIQREAGSTRVIYRVRTRNAGLEAQTRGPVELPEG